MKELLTHHFTLGLFLGLFVCLIVFVSLTFKLWALRREKADLKKILHTKMEIEAEGNIQRQRELESLKKQNENLRITAQSLRDKPGRKEMELLHVYDRALQLMFVRVPGFAQAWHAILPDAERLVAKYHRGILPLLKRVVNPSSAKRIELGALAQDPMYMLEAMKDGGSNQGDV